MKSIFTTALFFCGTAMAFAQTTPACPPIVTAGIGFPTSTGCPPEFQITAVTQTNSYLAYLYAATDPVNALATLEVIGTSAPITAFGDAVLLAGTDYIIKTVPISSNLGAMPAYTLTSAPFPAPAATGARGVMMVGCGVIDNNIVTNIPTVPISPCMPIGTFNTEVFGGTRAEVLQANSILVIRDSTAQGNNVSTTMKKSRYLHSLFDHYKASHKIRFLAVGVVFLEITPNNLKVERLPAQVPETNSTNGSTRTQTDDEHFSSFVNALNNLLVKKFPNNANNCISIKYAIPTFFQ